MPPYTRCALRVGWLEKCSKEVGVRWCRSAGIVTSCVNIAKVAEFLQTRFRIDLKSAVNLRNNHFRARAGEPLMPCAYVTFGKGYSTPSNCRPHATLDESRGMKIPLSKTKAQRLDLIDDRVSAAKQDGQERLTNGVFATNRKNTCGCYHRFEIGMFRVSNTALHHSCKGVMRLVQRI